MNDSGYGVYLPTNDASSTSGYKYHSFPANVQGQNSENYTSKMIPPEYYAFLVQKIELLQKDVTNLKEASKVSSNFFKQSVLLQRVCMVIIILLPITLTAVVATIAYVYCSDEQMISFAKWVLGILSMGSLIDLFVIFATHSIDQKRIEQIERRIDQLSK